MGSIKLNVLSALVLYLTGCGLYSNYYIAEYEECIPKRPQYKLKGKQLQSGYEIDTTGVFKLVEKKKDGKQLYPTNDPKSPLYKMEYYIKFYDSGRYLEVFLERHDEFKDKEITVVESLNPKDIIRIDRGYYYRENDRNLRLEHFLRMEYNGIYNEINYDLSWSQDTLVHENYFGRSMYLRLKETPSWFVFPKKWD